MSEEVMSAGRARRWAAMWMALVCSVRYSASPIRGANSKPPRVVGSTDDRVAFHTRTANTPELLGKEKVTPWGTASQWAFGGIWPSLPIFFPFK